MNAIHLTRMAILLTCAALPAAAAAPAKVVAGAYACWAHGAARMLLNFKVTGDKRYTNEDGDEKGEFVYDPSSGLISFKGGHLDGAMPDGFTAVYQDRKGRHVLSFRGRSGGEAAFCEHQAR
jgi:hypothetical protein